MSQSNLRSRKIDLARYLSLWSGPPVGRQNMPQGHVLTSLSRIEVKDHEAHVADGSLHQLCSSRVCILYLPTGSTIMDRLLLIGFLIDLDFGPKVKITVMEVFQF